MKRKKTVKKVAAQPTSAPVTTDLQDFQKAYGAQWLIIVQSTPFREAMYLLNKTKLASVTNLSDDHIERNGREILADLRGHLKHEDDLLTLHSRTEELVTEEVEEYVSPTEIAEHELVREKHRQQNQKERYG